MALLNKFTLEIKDPEFARLYNYSHINKVFQCGLILFTLRFIRLILGQIVQDGPQ
jgi:hypothetical protein